MNLELCCISSIGFELEDVRTILANMLPLLNGIHSFSLDVLALPTLARSYRDIFNKLKVLEMFHFKDRAIDETTLQTTVNFLTDWLDSLAERGGEEPKLCKAFIHSDHAFYPQISSAIREVVLVWEILLF